MAARDDTAWLADILANIALIERFTAGQDEARFIADDKTAYAVEAALLKISEAARRLNDDTRGRAKTLPWDAIKAARNVIAHEYHRLDRARLWLTVRQSLPALKRFVAVELKRRKA